MEFTLKTKLPELKGMGRAFPVAGASALNRLAQMAKTQISSDIRAKYNIKKMDIDPLIRVTRATANNLNASLIVTNKGIPLGYFGPRQTRAGASIAVARGARRVIAHSFIATMRHGKAQVFIRTSKARGPVKALYGPSVLQLFGGRHTRELVEQLVASKFPEIVYHEIDFRLRRANTVSASGDVYGSQGELVRQGPD
jgi:hypothetical protein